MSMEMIEEPDIPKAAMMKATVITVIMAKVVSQ